MIGRRGFIKGGSALFASAMFLSGSGCISSPIEPPRRLDKLGVQLYTLRDLMQQDVDATLAKVASIGYREVEFAGYFNRRPQDIKALLDDLGLVSPSAHITPAGMGDIIDVEDLDPEKLDRLYGKIYGPDNLLPSVEAAIEAAKVIGHDYLIWPWIPDSQLTSLANFENLAREFNRAGELCRSEGIGFAYHNHQVELMPMEGRVPLELLLEETDPELFYLEFDLYWATKAGIDPVRYFERFPGRIPCCHVKDMDSSGNFADVGAGSIDFSHLIRAAVNSGTSHFIVEHDMPEDAVKSIVASYRYLENLYF